MKRGLSQRDARAAMIRDMRMDRPAHSLLTGYIGFVRSQDPEAAQRLEADLVETFTTDEGLRVLKLFEKAVLLTGVQNGTPDSALREMNAVRNFVLEIRRLVSHEQ
jgi:hypothetical protein